MNRAEETGNYIMQHLSEFPELHNVRGRGLMIGFDVPTRKDLRATLLKKHHIFTGEAKPDVIRLLPALTLRQAEAMQFIDALKHELSPVKEPEAVA